MERHKGQGTRNKGQARLKVQGSSKIQVMKAVIDLSKIIIRNVVLGT